MHDSTTQKCPTSRFRKIACLANRTCLRYVVVVAYSLVFSVLCPGPARAESVLDEIFHRWESLRRIRTARYVLTGTQFIPRSLFGENVPESDFEGPEHRTLIVDFQRNRVAKTIDKAVYHDSLHRFVPTYETLYFDGKVVQEFRPRRRNPAMQLSDNKYVSELLVSANSPPAFFLDRQDSALLFMCAMFPHAQRNFVLTRELRLPLEGVGFQLEGRATVKGRDCIVLRSGNMSAKEIAHYSVAVDAQDIGRVNRCSFYVSGQEFKRVDLSYERFDESGAIFHIEGYERGVNGLRRTCEFDGEYTPNVVVSDSDFSMVPQPGQIVTDSDAQRRYQVAADGSPGIDVRMLYRNDVSASRRPWIVSSVFLVSVLCLVALFAWRARRHGTIGK